jgi:hypothetical protein
MGNRSFVTPSRLLLAFAGVQSASKPLALKARPGLKFNLENLARRLKLDAAAESRHRSVQRSNGDSLVRRQRAFAWLHCWRRSARPLLGAVLGAFVRGLISAFAPLIAALHPAAAQVGTATTASAGSFDPIQFQGQTANWSGFSLEGVVWRPFIWNLKISDPTGQLQSQANLTGIQIGIRPAYRIQYGSFVFGTYAKLIGGMIESMPKNSTERENMAGTFGGEAGFAFGSLYLYGFGGGGLAWESGSRPDLGTEDTLTSMIEVGIGLNINLIKNWYTGAELTYGRLGDFRDGPVYFNPEDPKGVEWHVGYKF